MSERLSDELVRYLGVEAASGGLGPLEARDAMNDLARARAADSGKRLLEEHAVALAAKDIRWVVTKEQAEEAARWFEGGIRVESAAQAGIMFDRAAHALRAFHPALEALENDEIAGHHSSCPARRVVKSAQISAPPSLSPGRRRESWTLVTP